jgi:fructose-1,6-bisphosphatase/inositol monophosphatase family enzyme
MRRYYLRAEKGIETKADKSPVTAADKEINDLLITRVSRTYPTHGVLGEEASTITALHTDVWVCDPIDGTAGFILGVPTAMFSLAFVQAGKPMLGVAYDPFADRLFTAVHTQGAFCNGQSVHVDPRGIDGALVAGPGSASGIFREELLYRDLIARGAIIPTFTGNVFKCTLIAEGKLHGRIFGGPGAHDIAAIKVIVEEAGGKVTDLEGNEQRYDRAINGAIISNGTIHQDLIAAANKFGGPAKLMGRTL